MLPGEEPALASLADRRAYRSEHDGHAAGEIALGRRRLPSVEKGSETDLRLALDRPRQQIAPLDDEGLRQSRRLRIRHLERRLALDGRRIRQRLGKPSVEGLRSVQR